LYIKKHGKSELVSIQVLAKVKGKSKLIKTIGSSRDTKEIEALFKKASIS
jgi:hypothetical protein